MIDRENKRIINGYGTVTVGASTHTNILKLEYIKPPQPVGESVDISEAGVVVMDKLKMRCTYDERSELLAKLREVTEQNNKFMFKGWEINFENFNIKSIEVWKDSATRMMMAWLAC